MKKYMVRFATLFALIVSIITASGVPVHASSSNMFPSVNKSYVIKGYCYRVHDSARKRVYVYYDESCSKRNSSEYVSANTDECYIVGRSSSKNNVEITYPTRTGRKDRWTTMAAFTSASSYKIRYATTTIKSFKFATSNSAYSYGSISRNDQVRVYETWNGYTRVLYPISGGYKLAWIKQSDANAYLSSSRDSGNSNSSVSQSSSITSPVPSGAKFSRKTSDNGWYGYHDINRGVSIGTPVYAIADGTITCKQAYRIYSGLRYLTSYGNYIEFRSDKNGYTAKYCHLNSFRGVSQSIPSYRTKKVSGNTGTYTLKTKHVKKGEIIGYIGTTGNSSGTHLHFELRKNGLRLDPTSVIKGLI